MTRVMVIGNAGGGKSTMSSVLSSLHELPYHAIDQIQWQPGWVPTPVNEFNKVHDALISNDRWLIDGYGSWDSVLKRMDAADTIIVVDHPIWVHYWWATKRQFKSIFLKSRRSQPDLPAPPATLRLYKMMWKLHTLQRSTLLKEAQYRSANKRYIHISSPNALTHFIDNPV